MMRCLAWVWIVLVAAACGQLPSLPNDAIDRVPAELEFNGLTLAVGFEGAGTAVQPDAILAGTAVEAMFTVRAQDGLPLAGALIQFGVKTERWARVLDFPLGTSCTTDTQGECSTVLRSEGRAGAVQLEARVAGLESQSTNLMVLPAEGQAQVLVEIEGLGTYNWATGQGVDPLDNESTRLVLDKNQPKGVALQVRLLDAFDNPLEGLPVRVVVQVEDLGVAPPDAGPLDVAYADSSGADAQPGLDVGAQGSGDTATPVDAGAHQDSGSAADAGANKVLNLAPNDERAMVALATAEGCPDGLAGGEQLSANAQADGYARFCIVPGQELGAFTLSIEPANLFRAGDTTSMQLSGETRAGAPSRVVYVPSHEPEQGETVRLGCLPGGLSAVATFRVENEQGSVPNVRVKFERTGGLSGLTSALEVSDQQGLVEVQAICPADSLAGGSILADLAATDADEPASVGVQVRTDGVDEITIVEHGAWPPTLRSGEDTLTLRIQALNEAGAPVVRAGLMPTNDGPDNREPLAFVVTIASPGHAGRVLLDAGDGEFTQPLVEQTVLVDQEVGAADFRFKLQSPATYGNPIILRVFEPGSQRFETRSLHVAPGAPSHITVSPSGTINAELLGAAGSFAFSVWDGDPAQGANRVPDVPISVAVPRSFVFLRGSNLTTIQGRTSNDGRFIVDVLQAQPIGDHSLEGSIIAGENESSASVRVDVGAGEVASALELRLDGERLPMITPEGGEALPTLTMRGGTRLDQTLSFRVVNRFGGGMPGLGLAWSLQEGAQGQCATFAEPGQTNAHGEVIYGPGALLLTAGGVQTDCVYRFAHGNTAAVQRLRVRQVPGLPNRATLAITLREGENDAASVRLRNSMDPPNEWSDDTSRELVLQAFDTNNLAPAGLRVWLEVDNCYLENRSAELDETGSASFRVAGGANAEAPCVLSARYFNQRQDYTPPTLNILGSGFVAPELSNVHFDGSGDSFKLVRPFNTEYTWRLEGTGIRGPAGWLNGQCPQEGQCTYGQIVEMSQTWNEQGERSVLRVLTDEIPLTTTIQNGERRYTVSVRQSMMGPGRWLGFRIKDAGGEQQGQQLESVSRAVEFTAIPPVDWVSNSPGGTPSRVSINGDGVSIRGGHRLNLDADDVDEFVLCGHAAGGRNFFSVVDRAQDGTLPAQVDAVLSVEGVRDAQSHPQNACRVADLDNDGHLDLVLPGPNRLPGAQAGFLGFTIHRGLDNGFFDAHGQHLVWQIPALLNLDSVHFVLRTGPASIVACIDSNCGSPRELFINWNAQTEQFSAGAMADHEALLGDHQRPSPDVAIEQYRVQQTGSIEFNLEPTQALGFSDDRVVYARSADGSLVLLGSTDYRRLYVHRVSDWSLVRSLVWNQTDVGFQVASFNTQGNRVAATTMAEDGHVVLWDLSQGNAGGTLDADRVLISAGVGHGLSVEFSPDDVKIAAAGRGDTARIWNVETGDVIMDLPGFYQLVSWHPDATKVLALNKFRGTRERDGEVLQIAPAVGGYDVSGVTPVSVFGRSIGGEGSVSRFYRIGDTARWKVLFDRAQIQDIEWNGQFEDRPHRFSNHSGWDASSNGALEAYSGSSNLGQMRIFAANPAPGRLLHTLGLGNHPVSNVVFGLGGDRVIYSVDGATYHHSISSLMLGDFLPSQTMGSISGGRMILPGHGAVADDLASYSNENFYLSRPITWRAGCGNGVVELGEVFDNGQPDEVSEYAYTCGAVCGDGVVQSGEHCDDGNDSNADQCLTTCLPHRCGDGSVRQDLQQDEAGYETCDDGNRDAFDGCGNDCNRCGDGILGDYEGCDDGNDVDNDGCTRCVLDTCGNGALDEGEVCETNDDRCLNCFIMRSATISSYSYSPNPDLYRDQNNDKLIDGVGITSEDGRGDLGSGTWVGWHRDSVPAAIVIDLGRYSFVNQLRAWNLWSNGNWGGFCEMGARLASRNRITDPWIDHGAMVQRVRYSGFNNVLRMGTLENQSTILARYLRLSVTCDVYEYAVFSEIEIE